MKPVVRASLSAVGALTILFTYTAVAVKDWNAGRWAIPMVFAVLFLVCASYNASTLIARLGHRRAGSWIPFVGGLAGVVAAVFWPAPSFRSWWPLPLFLDWGSVPGTLYALVQMRLQRARNEPPR